MPLATERFNEGVLDHMKPNNGYNFCHYLGWNVRKVMFSGTYIIYMFSAIYVGNAQNLNNFVMGIGV